MTTSTTPEGAPEPNENTSISNRNSEHLPSNPDSPFGAWIKVEGKEYVPVEEAAHLAANQCLYGLHGDDGGNSYCPEVARLKRELSTSKVELEQASCAVVQTYAELAALRKERDKAFAQLEAMVKSHQARVEERDDYHKIAIELSKALTRSEGVLKAMQTAKAVLSSGEKKPETP